MTTADHQNDPYKAVVIAILLLFSLAWGCSKSQAQGNVWYKSFYSNGVPTTKPVNPTIKFSNIDTVNHHGYIFQNNAWKIADGIMIGQKGDKGDTGAQGIPGKDGTDGTSGNSVTPEQFGACHCSTGTIDADAIQSATNTGKKVEFDGSQTYYIGKFLKKNKYQNFNWEGNFCTLIVTTTVAGDVVGSDQPTDLGDAIRMGSYSATVKNMMVSCNNTTQNGFNLRCSSNDLYEKVTVVNANWGFRSEFQLVAKYNMCTVLSSLNGAYIGIGTFPGATNDNAQSNGTVLSQFHTHTVSNIGIYIDASYECSIDHCIIEGNGTVQYGIYYNMKNSPTSKNGSLDFFHGEQVGGCTGAWIYVNMSNGSISLDNIICHYPGLVIDGQSSNSTGVINVSYFNYAVGDVNGKYFNSHSTMNFMFYLCYSFYPTVVPGRFISPAPTYCSNWGGCSGNSFSVITSR